MQTVKNRFPWLTIQNNFLYDTVTSQSSPLPLSSCLIDITKSSSDLVLSPPLQARC